MAKRRIDLNGRVVVPPRAEYVHNPPWETMEAIVPDKMLILTGKGVTVVNNAELLMMIERTNPEYITQRGSLSFPDLCRFNRVLGSIIGDYAEIDPERRMQIPKRFLKQLGWKPGDSLDVEVGLNYVNYTKT